MNFLTKYFDDFNRHSRVLPVLVIMLPVFAMFIIKGVINDSILTNTLYLMLLFTFVSLTAKIARENGKKTELKMYKKLGGLPTTIMLRFGDSRLSTTVKKRYHISLNKKFKDCNLPLDISKEVPGTDELYDSAITMLRNYANEDCEREPRVYSELKEYNFWRNLYGGKIIALIIYAFLGIREYVLMEGFDLVELYQKPFPKYVSLTQTSHLNKCL